MRQCVFLRNKPLDAITAIIISWLCVILDIINVMHERHKTMGAALERMNNFLGRMDAMYGIVTPETKPEVKQPPLFFGCDVKQLNIDVSPKGIITGYLTVFDWSDTGLAYVDAYNDVVTRGMFDTSYKALDRTRRARGDDYLCPSLVNHKPELMVGGVTDLSQDSKGYIYTSKLAMKLPRAQEVFELAKQKMIYASYGYSPVSVTQRGKQRVLNAVDWHEQSFVTFPANGLASVISAKHTTFASYPSAKDNGIWARLSPDSPHSGLTASSRTAIKALDRRWDAFKPPSASTRTASARWATLAPENDEDEYTMEDLLDGVHYLMNVSSV